MPPSTAPRMVARRTISIRRAITTRVRHAGEWLEVEHQRMDASIVIDAPRHCRKLARLRRVIRSSVFSTVSCRARFRERDRHGFAFMYRRHLLRAPRRNERVSGSGLIREVRARGAARRLSSVLSSSTRARVIFCDLILRGYVGPAWGTRSHVHIHRGALYGTSLGVSLKTGVPVKGAPTSHARHQRHPAVGGIRPAVASGLLTSG